MNYQSPIEVVQTEMRSQIEGEIYKAVINVGVNVDKDELIKALEYDRGQYQKGYYDRDSEIVRCKYCRQNGECSIQFKFAYPDKPEEWFCAYGEREANTKPTSGSSVSIDDFYKQIKDEWNQLRQQKDADPNVLQFLVRLMEFVESID